WCVERETVHWDEAQQEALPRTVRTVAAHHRLGEVKVGRELHRAAVAGTGVRGQIFIPRCPATEKMSLSPRPHMFITMRPSLPSSFAMSPVRASACAGSSAGMMPSRREQSWNASSASLSVQVRYSAL